MYYGRRNKSPNLCGWFSAPQKDNKSNAVILLCLREGTNTMTGFLDESLVIDW